MFLEAFEVNWKYFRNFNFHAKIYCPELDYDYDFSCRDSKSLFL